jgi:chromatin segregation and condensation protein Rec8/ScpA/Scc1 (kleisin family)
MTYELSLDEIAQLDIRAAANVMLNRTIDLAKRTNAELLEPISKWIDDPHFMDKFKVILDDKIDWAGLKRKQREWTNLQKLIQAERMRLYHQKLAQKKRLKMEISKVFGGNREAMRRPPVQNTGNDSISPIISVFAPESIRQIETDQKFETNLNLSIRDKLPWTFMLADEIQHTQSFTELSGYTDSPARETVAKLQTLLQMETDGTIQLSQQEPFGTIKVTSIGFLEGSFTIIDRQGQSSEWDWQELSDAQKSKIIADAMDNMIMVRCA